MVLILGKSGYISKRFQDYFNYKKIDYKVESLRDYPTPYNIDIILERVKPTYVINCIGYTGTPNVDACEIYKKECLYANVVIAEIVADSCEKYSIPLGFVSSGCIYTEDEVEWYRIYSEKSLPNFTFAFDNCSWYSGCKALGESIVKKSCSKSYIYRLRMPFNHIDDKKNYLTKIMNYDKVWNSPNSLTNIDEFVKNCYLSLVNKIPYGIYNFTNSYSICAREIFEIAKKYNIGKENYNYFSDVSELNSVIKTPRSNCELDNSKIIKEGIVFLDSRESLEKCFKSWNKKEDTIFW